MKLIDLTLQDLADNLALDEALLDEADAADGPREALRLWEAPRTAVVVGRASQVHREVDVGACRQRNIPILRRCSGGAAVVIGPGCLMYAVVLSYQRRPALRMIAAAHRFVLEHVAAAISRDLADVQPEGTSDLAWNSKKFSGNSLRCKRTHLLYHGTLLYDFPLDVIGACLKSPPRQPAYRAGRRHREFITNLPLDAPRLRAALIDTFAARQRLTAWPRETTQRLVEQRYAHDEWNLRR